MRSCVPACSTRAGVRLSPKPAARRPPVSKKKGRRWRRIRSSGRPASSTIFEGRSCASAQAISASRLPSTNSRSRASTIRSSGLTRVPAAAMSVPSGVRISRATVMAGSNRRLRSSAAGAMPGTGSGSSSFIRARSRASCSSRASSPERRISTRRASISASRSGSATGQVAPRTPRSFAVAAAGEASASATARAAAANGRKAGEVSGPFMAWPSSADRTARRRLPGAVRSADAVESWPGRQGDRGPPVRPAAPPDRATAGWAWRWRARGFASRGTRPISA